MTADMVLVDTSAWILALRKNPHIYARTRIEELMGANRIGIIPLIYIELLSGVNNETEFHRLKQRLSSLKQIPLTKRDWDKIAFNAFKLRRKGITVPHIDIIIGTAAAINDMVLLTADSHFNLMAKEIGLKVENIQG